jgi:hypothetical protein
MLKANEREVCKPIYQSIHAWNFSLEKFELWWNNWTQYHSLKELGNFFVGFFSMYQPKETKEEKLYKLRNCLPQQLQGMVAWLTGQKKKNIVAWGPLSWRAQCNIMGEMFCC